MIIKMCGITRPEDAVEAVSAGADWLGLNFWPRSKRYVTVGQAVQIAAAARRTGDVDIVGVFVNQPDEDIAAASRDVGLDRVQLHGDETPAQCARYAGRYIKALGLRSEADVARLHDYDTDVFIVDTPTPDYGGSGVVGDWGLARRAVATGKLVVLAGGLNPGNVRAAIDAVAPFGVDVAGGIESAPGIKDSDRMRRFVAAVRG